MKKNTVHMKPAIGSDTIEVGRDMIKYFESMGYTLVEKSDKSNIIKLKPKKDKE